MTGRGQGIAQVLTEAAVDFARSSQHKVATPGHLAALSKQQVVPSCSYSAYYFTKHTEQSDVLNK